MRAEGGWQTARRGSSRAAESLSFVASDRDGGRRAGRGRASELPSAAWWKGAIFRSVGGIEWIES